MTSNVKMILDEVNARIKLAEAKTAEDPSNFDSFPGAENDKAVPAETKKPDPEVKDEGPASRTEVTGAEPGSDVPLQQDHLYEADEPVLTPEKKPAESDEADAKTAEANPDVTKVAADILGIIKRNMSKKAACGTAAKCAPAAKDKAETKKEDKTKEAENRAMELGSRIMDKIAELQMAKQAGAADARRIMAAAADYNRGVADANALVMKVAQALEEEAAAEQAADDGVDPAVAGAADAEAAIADAAAAEQSAPTADDPVTPEEVAEAVTELVQEGQISQEEAATLIGQMGADVGADAAGGIDEEQLTNGIVQAIENGDITEDEAQQLVQELVAAGADPSVQEQITAEDIAAAEAAGQADAVAAIDAAQKEAAAYIKKAQSVTGYKSPAAIGALQRVGAELAGKGSAAPAPAAPVEDPSVLERLKKIFGEYPLAPTKGGYIGAGATGGTLALTGALMRALSKDKNHSILSNPVLLALLGSGAGYVGGNVIDRALAESTATPAPKTVTAEAKQIARYQQGFIQKCAEHNVNPSKVAQYIQARTR